VTLRRGRFAEAETQLRPLTEELETILGPDNAELVPGYALLGWSLVGQGRRAEALPLLERGLELQAMRSDHALDSAFLEYLHARANFELGRDRAQMHRRIRELATLLATSPGHVSEVDEVAAWLREHPAG
jgi:hypothetical protein